MVEGQLHAKLHGRVYLRGAHLRVYLAYLLPTLARAPNIASRHRFAAA